MSITCADCWPDNTRGLGWERLFYNLLFSPKGFTLKVDGSAVLMQCRQGYAFVPVSVTCEVAVTVPGAESTMCVQLPGLG